MSYSLIYRIFPANILLIIFLSTGISDSFSQIKNTPELIEKDFNTFLNDGSDLIKRPANWNVHDWLKLTAIVGSSAALSLIDDEAQDLVYRNPGYSQSYVMKFGKWYGEPIITAAVAGSFYTWGLLDSDDEARMIGLEVTESFIYAGLITTIIKVGIGRERPYLERGQYNFRPFKDPLAPGANEHFSWPSGHSTVAFSLSTVLASHTESYWLKTLLYTPAVLTAVSRVYHNQHWVSDVFMGAAVGYFVGDFITSKHSEEKNTKQKVSINYGPGFIHLAIPL